MRLWRPPCWLWNSKWVLILDDAPISSDNSFFSFDYQIAHGVAQRAVAAAGPVFFCYSSRKRNCGTIFIYPDFCRAFRNHLTACIGVPCAQFVDFDRRVMQRHKAEKVRTSCCQHACDDVASGQVHESVEHIISNTSIRKTLGRICRRLVQTVDRPLRCCGALMKLRNSSAH